MLRDLERLLSDHQRLLTLNKYGVTKVYWVSLPKCKYLIVKCLKCGFHRERMSRWDTRHACRAALPSGKDETFSRVWSDIYPNNIRWRRI